MKSNFAFGEKHSQNVKSHLENYSNYQEKEISSLKRSIVVTRLMGLYIYMCVCVCVCVCVSECVRLCCMMDFASIDKTTAGG